jgi:hypothetical protein
MQTLRTQVAELSSSQSSRQIRELTQQVTSLQRELAEQRARSSAGNNDASTPAAAAATVKMEAIAQAPAGQPPGVPQAAQPGVQHAPPQGIQHVSMHPVQQLSIQPVQQVSVQGLDHMQVQPVQQVSLVQHVQPASQGVSQQMPQLQASMQQQQAGGMFSNAGTSASAPSASAQPSHQGEAGGQQKMQDVAALELRMAAVRSEMDARALMIAQAAQVRASPPGLHCIAPLCVCWTMS